MIRANAKFNNQRPVLLASCETGKGDYAQSLANILRVNVYAPDCYAYYYMAGEVANVVYYHEIPGTLDMDINAPGKLIMFKPE